MGVDIHFTRSGAARLGTYCLGSVHRELGIDGTIDSHSSEPVSGGSIDVSGTKECCAVARIIALFLVGAAEVAARLAQICRTLWHVIKEMQTPTSHDWARNWLVLGNVAAAMSDSMTSLRRCTLHCALYSAV